MYHESRRMKWIWILMGVNVLGTGLLAAVIVQCLLSGKPIPFGMAVGLCIWTMVMAVAWWPVLAFQRYFVLLDAGRLYFGFNGWFVSLPLDEIARVQNVNEPDRIMFGKRVGWSWIPGAILYKADANGPVLRLETRNGRLYVFSCQEPERLLAELNAQGVPTEP